MGMSIKTFIAFLVGALAASTGTAAALSTGHVFRLQQGDHAKYGNTVCSAIYDAQYKGFDCVGVRRYRVIYSPSELRVLRSNARRVSKTVFVVDPSGG
jgi:hypothetical protein